MKTFGRFQHIFCLLALVCLGSTPKTIASALTFPDPMASLSKYDNLNKILKSGFPFEHVELLMHACTYGSKVSDPLYARRKEQLSHLRFHWGAYAYIHPEINSLGVNEPVDRQAHYFVHQVAQYENQQVHDQVLLSATWFRPKEKSTIPTTHGVAMFCAVIHRETGTWPLLFVDVDLLMEVLSAKTGDLSLGDEDAAILSQCPLWISYLDTEIAFPPVLPSNSPWKTWTFCLYTSQDDPKTHALDAPVGSLPPDLSLFNGKRGEELDQWYNKHAWDYKSPKKGE